MKPLNTRLFSLLSLFLIILLGAGLSFAQGKGKGKGGGNRGGGGGGGHQRGGGPPAGRQGPPQGRMQRPQQVQRQQHAQRPPQAQRQQHIQRAPQMQRPQRQHPQMQRQMRAQRPQRSMPQMQRQPQRMQQRSHPQQRAARPDLNRGQQKQQMRAQNGRGRGQEMKANRGRGAAPTQIFQNDRGRGNGRQQALKGNRGRGNDRQQAFKGNRGRGNSDGQVFRNNDRNRVRTAWDGRSAGRVRTADSQNWNGSWYKNRGQQRSAEVHARNADRKARRDGSRSIGGYFTGGDQFRDWGSRIYVRNSDPWRDNILRSVIVNVLSSDGGYYYSPSYANGYYDPYYDQGYYDYDQGYYDYYDAYSAYSDYYYPEGSYYNFYSPLYIEQHAYTPVYYDGGPYYVDYYSEDLGLPYLAPSSSIGGFVENLFGELIAYGYNQGYQDALYARSHGLNTSYYNDPYDPYVYVEEEVVFEDVGYNPYSCFGLNRRYMSEGYELGYRDAIYGETEYDPYDDGSNVDLVSVIISTVMSFS